jgi:hypothetical protein
VDFFSRIEVLGSRVDSTPRLRFREQAVGGLALVLIRVSARSTLLLSVLHSTVVRLICSFVQHCAFHSSFKNLTSDIAFYLRR